MTADNSPIIEETAVFLLEEENADLVMTTMGTTGLHHTHFRQHYDTVKKLSVTYR